VETGAAAAGRRVVGKHVEADVDAFGAQAARGAGDCPTPAAFRSDRFSLLMDGFHRR
jgi:hypothetical protein